MVFKKLSMIIVSLGILGNVTFCGNIKDPKEFATKDDTYVLAALLASSLKGTACGVPASQEILYVNQNLLANNLGIGYAPFDWSVCKPVKSYTTGGLRSIQIGGTNTTPDTSNPIISTYSYGSNGKISTISAVIKKTIAVNTSANSVTGCPANSSTTQTLLVDLKEIETFTYGSDGELSTVETKKYCHTSTTESKSSGDKSILTFTFSGGKIASFHSRSATKPLGTTPETYDYYTNPQQKEEFSYTDTQLLYTITDYQVVTATSSGITTATPSTDVADTIVTTITKEGGKLKSGTGKNVTTCSTVTIPSGATNVTGLSGLCNPNGTATTTTNITQSNLDALSSTRFSDIVTTFESDSNGNLIIIYSVTTPQNTATNPTYSITNYVYDDKGRFIITGFSTTTVFDENGLLYISNNAEGQTTYINQ